MIANRLTTCSHGEQRRGVSGQQNIIAVALLEKSKSMCRTSIHQLQRTHRKILGPLTKYFGVAQFSLPLSDRKTETCATLGLIPSKGMPSQTAR